MAYLIRFRSDCRSSSCCLTLLSCSLFSLTVSSSCKRRSSTGLSYGMHNAYIGPLRLIRVVVLAQSRSLLLEFFLSVSQLRKSAGCRLVVPSELLERLTFFNRQDARLCFPTKSKPN